MEYHHRLSYHRFWRWYYFCLPILLLMSCYTSSSSSSSSCNAAKKTTDDDVVVVHPQQQQYDEFRTTKPKPESESKSESESESGPGPEPLQCKDTEITTTKTTETDNNNKSEGEVITPRRRRRRRIFPIDSLQEPTTNICLNDNSLLVVGRTDDDDDNDDQSDHLLKDDKKEEEKEEVAIGTYHHHQHQQQQHSIHLQVLDEYTTKQGDTLIELLGPTNNNNNEDIIENSAIPIIITIGHGGKLKPNYIQNRSKGSMLSDLYTDEIGYKLALKIIDDSSERFIDIIDIDIDIDNNNNKKKKQKQRLIPYLIMNHLHRSKLDVNRNVDVAVAQGDKIAKHAWYTYHDFIYQAQIKLKQVFGTTIIQGKKKKTRRSNTCTTTPYKEDYDDDDDNNDDNDEIYNIEGIPGLLIDIHGYGGKNYRRNDGGNNSSSSSPPPFIHWGYGLKKKDFSSYSSSSSSTNDVNSNSNYLDETKSTFEFATSLLRRGDDDGGGDIESLISGPLSLGSRFYNEFRKIRNFSNNNCSISTTNSNNILNDDDDDDDDDMIEKSNHHHNHHHLLGIGLPSYEYPNPNNITNDRNWCDINMTCPYFSGGYTTLAHTYLDWQQQYDYQHKQKQQITLDDNIIFSDVITNDKGNDKNKQQQCSIRMNTVQIEIPKQIRFGMNDDGSKGSNSSRNQIHNEFVDALSKSLIGFVCDVFGRERANNIDLLTTGKDSSDDDDDDDKTCRKNDNNIIGSEEHGKLPEYTLSSKL